MSSNSRKTDTMPFDADRPYNSLPALPPLHDVESRKVLKACVEARAALAEVKIAGQLIPNQTILINSIPLLEAQASSEIENIVTTTDRLFRYVNEPGNGADPATKEALRCRTALQQGFAMLGDRPLSTRTAVETCRTIKGVDMDIRVTPGTALCNDASGRIVYTPPEGADRIRDMLANWERFIHDRSAIDPLVRMAIAHYQFEAIHPFTDGNGRTGRILNLLMLVDQGLLDIPVLYLSRFIIEHKEDYYRLLLEVTTSHRWEDWILFMLRAVHETAKWTNSKIRSIKVLLDETARSMKADAPKIYSRELVDLIFLQPYCRISDVVEAGIARRQAASVYLRTLAETGLLKEMRVGREKIFINPRLMRELTSRDFTFGVVATPDQMSLL